MANPISDVIPVSHEGLYSVIDDKTIERNISLKSEGVAENAFTLIDSIVETTSYISAESASEVKLRFKSSYVMDSENHATNDVVLLDNSFLYTTFSYSKNGVNIGVIVIYNTFDKTFRTITTTKYIHNHLHLVGYLKTLEFAKECGATVIKVYTDNEVPTLINNNVLDTWLSMNCIVDGSTMIIKPYLQEIKSLTMSFKKKPYAKRLDINRNKILLLLKNIAVKISLNILADLKGDHKLKNKRMELDVEIARLSIYVFSKQIVIFESNDVDFE